MIPHKLSINDLLADTTGHRSMGTFAAVVTLLNLEHIEASVARRYPICSVDISRRW